MLFFNLYFYQLDVQVVALKRIDSVEQRFLLHAVTERESPLHAAFSSHFLTSTSCNRFT